MITEHQNIEFKKSWHDDYLKWVCGFANAQGGVMYIGQEDNGNIIGVTDVKHLMEEIPGKIKSLLGIYSQVNLLQHQDKYYIEIQTAPCSVPISLRGRFYMRAGATNQELIGPSLNDFLLRKSGKTWDDAIEPRASFDDINETTVATFLKAAEKAGRIPDLTDLTIPELFDKLRLLENNQLKRAAVVLFGKDPGKFYPNLFIKIGRFGNDDADLRFQETEEGNIITILQSVLNQLDHKFLIRSVAFQGMNRLEIGEYPEPAMREMLLNALVHRNYMGAPTQIRVYDDKLNIWNDGGLPLGYSTEMLKTVHASNPRNPIIAQVCFKGGYIDAWGRGTIKIFDECKKANLPEPELMERDGGFIVTLSKNVFTSESLSKQGLSERQTKALAYLRDNASISNTTYQQLFNVSKPTATRDLTELAEKYNLLKKQGKTGKGTEYTLI